jgi:WD40 repeat protein
MPRPLPLLSLFLLALLTTEIPAAYAQKSRQVKPAPPPKPALRLVVQQGMSNVSHGFIIFSPDGRLLATSVGPNLRLWDLWTGQRLWLATHADHAFFTPPEADGRPPDGERVLVATANNGGNTRQMLVKVYDVDAGSAEGTLRRPGFRVDSFAWTPVIRRRACRARASSRGRWGVGA